MTCTNGAWYMPHNIHCSSDTTPVLSGCPSFSVQTGWGVFVVLSSCTSGIAVAGSSCTLECSDTTNKYIDGSARVSCQDDGRYHDYARRC